MSKAPKDFLYFLLSSVVYALPLTLLAGGEAKLNANAPTDATSLINNIGTFVLNPIILVLFTVAFVVFIWGLVVFVSHLDNEESRGTGGKHMIWGIIGMVIMVGVNSIIAIIQNTIAQLGG